MDESAGYKDGMASPLRKVLNVYMAKVPRPLDSPNAPAEN